MPIVLYKDTNNCRGQFKGTLEACWKFVQNTHLYRWAIYRDTYKGHKFHNATDERFLIDHDDVYWHNRRFGRGQALVTLERGGWTFWVLRKDARGFYSAVLAEIDEPGSFLSFSRQAHTIARENGYTDFVPDQSLLGGYFVDQAGNCLHPQPSWMARPHWDICER